ncbi:MAG: transglycosylase SLT domain-containing protein [Patescibacteria group bacterium]
MVRTIRRIMIPFVVATAVASFLVVAVPLPATAQGVVGVKDPACVITDPKSAIKINFPLPGITQSATITPIVGPPETYPYAVKNLPCFVVGIYVYFAGVAGILATVMIMYGGIKYITSYGNPQRITDAKDNIFSALVGLALTLCAYVLLNFINPNLTSLRMEAVPSIEKALLGDPDMEKEQVGERGASPSSWSSGNVEGWDATLALQAGDAGVDKSWLKAIMMVESGGDPNAESAAGACGLMQILPSTAEEVMGIKGIDCAYLKGSVNSISVAAQYLAQLSGKRTGKVDACPASTRYKSTQQVVACNKDESKCSSSQYDPYVIAAYNGGPGANCSSVTCPGMTWWQCEQNPGYAETRNYVKKVERAYNTIKDLW